MKEELLPHMSKIVRLNHEINIHIADGKVLKSELKGKVVMMC